MDSSDILFITQDGLAFRTALMAIHARADVENRAHNHGHATLVTMGGERDAHRYGSISIHLHIDQVIVDD